MVILVHEVGHVLVESVVQNAFAYSIANADDETFVMNTGESFAGDFVDFIKMVEVGGSVVLAAVTVAVWIERREICAIFGVLDINATMWRVKRAVTGLAGWGDAVESVAAVHSANKQIAWFATHAKQMTWLIVRKDFVRELDHVGGFWRLGRVEGTDAKTVNGLQSHKFGRLAAEIFEEAALNNGVEILL